LIPTAAVNANIRMVRARAVGRRRDHHDISRQKAEIKVL
jgi:hypothetical protein